VSGEIRGEEGRREEKRSSTPFLQYADPERCRRPIYMLSFSE
jgi:hypothetical protein